jgi:hypothetical protein
MAVATRESFAEILRNVCAQRGWELLPSGVNVTHRNGRHQLVRFELFEFGERQLVRLISMIGTTKKLRREQLDQALRANLRLAHGALALEADDLCMTDTLSLDESDPADIESAVAFLAEMADYYEQILFGTDTH